INAVSAFLSMDVTSLFLLFSYACAFLDDDPAYEYCSTNTPPGSLSICRRSPRLLSNGYYIWTEDSFLSDEEGNTTLTPSQTSVTYKENLVRVFRRRKKIRRSLASLFSLDASTSWSSSTIPTNVDSSHLDDPWPDECNQLEANRSDVGNHQQWCLYWCHLYMTVYSVLSLLSIFSPAFIEPANSLPLAIWKLLCV
uniref:Transmembrane protein 71 n=1 Tax=Amazona collaria TaxID=241587 RepID=A0A8B9EW69_9PSIT